MELSQLAWNFIIKEPTDIKGAVHGNNYQSY